MTTTTPYGPDDRPRKKPTIRMQGLLVASIVCLVLIALVAGLHYGTAGHSAPSGYTSCRGHGPWMCTIEGHPPDEGEGNGRGMGRVGVGRERAATRLPVVSPRISSTDVNHCIGNMWLPSLPPDA
jgi:hypothetical protein